MASFSNNPALRSHLETQVDFMTELTQQSYDAARKLSDLNLQFSQQMVEDSLSASRQLMSNPDPAQFSVTLMNQLTPMTQHLRSYTQQLFGLLAGAQVDLSRTAQARIPEAGRSAAAMAEELARTTSQAGEAFRARQRSAFESMGNQTYTPNGDAQKPS